MSNPACEPTPHPVSGSPPDVPSTLVPPTAAGDEPQPAAPGSMLDKFRIISVLGRGSTGIIYEAEDTVLQRRVAIRHLLGAGAHAGEQFAAGVAAIARLAHPNIVATYETGLFENGSPYLASEFVGGGNAADRLAVVGRLPWRDATRIVTDACRGLAAAHSAGIVHGHFTPANLLIAHDGTVKISDFRLVSASAGALADRQPDTPRSLPPEQCRDHAPDVRSDIYALGATYFTLLTGRPPFGDDGPVRQSAHGQSHSPVPNVCAGIPTIPLRCDAIIRKAMASDAALRYPTAAAMLADLEIVIRTNDVSALTLLAPALLKPPRTPVWKALAAWMAGAAALAAVVVTLYYVFVPQGPAGASPRSSSSKSQLAPATALPTVTNSVGMVLARVPAGDFIMGDALIPDARPPHLVRISRPFLIGVHEVTQEQYRLVTGTNPSAVRGDRQPVEQVTWDEALAFCEALSARDVEKVAGRIYRLPTEAEWEYCCRAGAPGAFALGPMLTPQQANFRGSGLMGTAPVGTYPPNAWGLFDMHGNVGEWCADWYDLDSYAGGASIDPTGPEDGTKRVVRGGAWNSRTGDCRSGKRFDTYAPDFRGRDIGFRVVCLESKEK